MTKPFFSDVASSFVSHYSDCFANSKNKIPLFYDPQATLKIDEKEFKGKDNVSKAVMEFGSTISSSYSCHPLKDSEVLITGINPDHSAVFSFVLVDIGNDHQFSISHQTISKKV